MRTKSVATTIFVALMLVIGIDYVSLAASGQGFLLGRSNSASTTTTLTRTTAGNTLVLNSASGSAPLKVNRPVKAVNLNADRLDGLEGAALQTHAKRFRLPAKSGTNISYAFTGLAPGLYLASYHINASSTGTLHCWLTTTSSPTGYTMWDAGSAVDGFLFAGATGLVDTRAAGVTLDCNGGTLSITSPSEVVFTRINALAAGTAARQAGGSERIAPGAPR